MGVSVSEGIGVSMGMGVSVLESGRKHTVGIYNRVLTRGKKGQILSHLSSVLKESSFM